MDTQHGHVASIELTASTPINRTGVVNFIVNFIYMKNTVSHITVSFELGHNTENNVLKNFKACMMQLYTMSSTQSIIS